MGGRIKVGKIKVDGWQNKRWQNKSCVARGGPFVINTKVMQAFDDFNQHNF